MFLATEKEVCILRNMFCEIKSIAFKIKILTCLLLYCSFENKLSEHESYHKFSTGLPPLIFCH